MIYRFDTTVTMKPYNNKKWWINADIVRPFETEADNLTEALKDFCTHASDSCVDISKTALKNKHKMFIDTANGPQQTGFVITGKTMFDDDRRRWIEQYIDLWVSVRIVTSPWDC